MTVNWKKIALGLGILDGVIINGLVGWMVVKPRIVSEQIPVVKTEFIDECGEKCQAYIDSKLVTATPVPTIVPASSPQTKIVYTKESKAKVRSVTYVPIPGLGSTTGNDWTTLVGTDFYFNTADYPGLVEVYMEANIRLVNGNGLAYVQLFDVNHGIGVQGSDIKTAEQTSTLVVSGKVSFWAGKNLIRVQAKSLTADTAVFDGGRLRVVVEN